MQRAEDLLQACKQQKGEQTDRQAGEKRQINRSGSDRHRDKQAKRQTDKQTGDQTDIE